MAAMAVAGCDSGEEAALRVVDDDFRQSFVPAPDLGGGRGGTSFECNPRTQDCPAGQKCMPWAGDGGGAWNSTPCSPVADDPGAPGDPCIVERTATSGLDDCERGALCWYVDSESLQGTCIAMHTGGSINRVCPDPLEAPLEAATGVFLPCVARCNPLGSECGTGERCSPVVSWRADFVCYPDTAREPGTAGDVCGACAPGLACIDGADVPSCDGAACCAPYCDLDNPDCPPGTDCQPWDPPLVVPGKENAGICRV